jgi:hypothetical protein
MDSTEKAMMAAAGVAVVALVMALGMAALQALANPSGTVVVSVSLIVATGIVGMLGLAAFGVLRLLNGSKRR